VVRVLQVRDHREVDESRSLSRDQDPVDVTRREDLVELGDELLVDRGGVACGID